MAYASRITPSLNATGVRGNLRGAVTSLCKKIRSRTGQSGRIPFDPVKCAQELGVQIDYQKMPDKASGQVRLGGAVPVIVINSSHGTQRQRFTLCHEIAHLCLLEYDVAGTWAETDANWEERMCNRIATELLMPSTRFSRGLAGLRPSLRALIGIADTYDVSIQAALFRARDIGLWSVGIRVWELEGSMKIRNLRQQVTVRRGIRSRTSRHAESVRIAGLLRHAHMVLFGEDGFYSPSIPMARDWSYSEIPLGIDSVVLMPRRPGEIRAFHVR